MLVLDQQILRTDVAGMPLEWIGYREAAGLYHRGRVLYGLGSLLYTLHGGVNARSGRRTLIEVNSIIATSGERIRPARSAATPLLTNDTLFRRDGHLCLYCGRPFGPTELSRDHVTPISRGGKNTWSNVVASCRRCNQHKSGRSPEEAGMPLLAVPFTPTRAEYVYLQGRRILADQMEFLRSHFPRTSPIHERLTWGSH